jgi:hypothetical protein
MAQAYDRTGWSAREEIPNAPCRVARRAVDERGRQNVPVTQAHVHRYRPGDAVLAANNIRYRVVGAHDDGAAYRVIRPDPDNFDTEMYEALWAAEDLRPAPVVGSRVVDPHGAAGTLTRIHWQDRQQFGQVAYDEPRGGKHRGWLLAELRLSTEDDTAPDES